MNLREMTMSNVPQGNFFLCNFAVFFIRSCVFAWQFGLDQAKFTLNSMDIKPPLHVETFS